MPVELAPPSPSKNSPDGESLALWLRQTAVLHHREALEFSLMKFYDQHNNLQGIRQPPSVLQKTVSPQTNT